MVIGIVTASVSVPEAQSAKERHGMVRALVERARQRMNVSAAEVDGDETSSTVALAFVTVAANSTIVQSRLADVSEFLRRNPRYILVRLRTEML
jgi:uncharacterized protein